MKVDSLCLKDLRWANVVSDGVSGSGWRTERSPKPLQYCPQHRRKHSPTGVKEQGRGGRRRREILREKLLRKWMPTMFQLEKILPEDRYIQYCSLKKSRYSTGNEKILKNSMNRRRKW